MPRTKAVVGIEEIAGLMKGLRSARQQSPFFTMVIRDEWLVSFDYAIVIHSIHSMLKNSIHSIQKLMNGPTESTTWQVRFFFFFCMKTSHQLNQVYRSPRKADCHWLFSSSVDDSVALITLCRARSQSSINLGLSSRYGLHLLPGCQNIHLCIKCWNFSQKFHLQAVFLSPRKWS